VTPFEDTASPGAGNNPQMHPGGRMTRTAHCGFTHVETPMATQALRFGKWKANHFRIFSPQTTSPTMESGLPRQRYLDLFIFGWPPILGGVPTIAMGDISQLLGAHAYTH